MQIVSPTEPLPVKRFYGFRQALPLDLFFYRHQKGWSLTQAAAKSGLSETEIEQIELADFPLETDKILKLAQLYGAAAVADANRLALNNRAGFGHFYPINPALYYEKTRSLRFIIRF